MQNAVFEPAISRPQLRALPAELWHQFYVTGSHVIACLIVLKSHHSCSPNNYGNPLPGGGPVGVGPVGRVQPVRGLTVLAGGRWGRTLPPGPARRVYQVQRRENDRVVGGGGASGDVGGGVPRDGPVVVLEGARVLQGWVLSLFFFQGDLLEINHR